jgi:ribosomal 50S subunit-recycling heat shock protein
MELPAARAPARPTPLPWMLLVVSLSLTAGVLVLGRVRLEEERTRSANALKANDELKARLKQVEADLAARPPTLEPGDETAALKKQVVTLELEKRRLQEELHARAVKKR